MSKKLSARTHCHQWVTSLDTYCPLRYQRAMSCTDILSITDQGHHLCFPHSWRYRTSKLFNRSLTKYCGQVCGGESKADQGHLCAMRCSNQHTVIGRKFYTGSSMSSSPHQIQNTSTHTQKSIFRNCKRLIAPFVLHATEPSRQMPHNCRSSPCTGPIPNHWKRQSHSDTPQGPSSRCAAFEHYWIPRIDQCICELV